MAPGLCCPGTGRPGPGCVGSGTRPVPRSGKAGGTLLARPWWHRWARALLLRGLPLPLASPRPGQGHGSPAVLISVWCAPKGPEQRDGQPRVPAAAEQPAQRRAHLRDALAALQLQGKAQPSGSPPRAAQRNPTAPSLPQKEPPGELCRPAGVRGRSRAVIHAGHTAVGWRYPSRG